MQRIPLEGKKYGKLLVVELSSRRGNADQPIYKCVCDCGRKIETQGAHLRNGRTKSCGCLRIESSIKVHTTHGMSKTSTYAIWDAMRYRCNSPKYKEYKYYGGRGIKVCKRWNKFVNFLKDMGEKPRGRTLDRIDNSKGYSKNNCRWATPRQQSNNRRPRTKKI